VQDPKEPPKSSINAPIHKFQWLHVPGSVHQGIEPYLGLYTYTVTPRYFDGRNSLLPMDPKLSAAVSVSVVPFVKGALQLGFTRGYTQSQAFVHRFGLKARISPNGKVLVFDTAQKSGTSASGQSYTFLDEYKWLGFTARKIIFDVLDAVLADRTLHLDLFAYDLNEPDLIEILLKLGRQKRVRIILDNAALHHSNSTSKPKHEDEFQVMFNKASGGKPNLKRGRFGRYAHDKVFIISNKRGAIKVLTGSTNFSVTGLYVNSNHVIVFDDPKVAGEYSAVFDEAWNDGVNRKAFTESELSSKTFSFSSKTVPRTEITFAPHTAGFVGTLLGGIAARIKAEGTKKENGSVFFAVMQIDKGVSPVYTALNDLHAQHKIFSYGISDSPKGIYLYKPGSLTGLLVTGKPVNTQLPPPFNQVPNIGGVGHQIHHKFVVCGFNSDDPVVFCGSSNLAIGGEELNGDNLLEIHDNDVATAFVIEALALVDHFNFLDHYAKGPKGRGRLVRSVANQSHAAVSAAWFLSTTDKWAQPYFDPNDLHYAARELFG